MKNSLAILLLLLIAVWCEDSTHGQQPAKYFTNTIGIKLKLIPAAFVPTRVFAASVKS